MDLHKLKILLAESSRVGGGGGGGGGGIFISTLAFPYKPSHPARCAVPYLDGFDVGATGAKIARLGSYPGIIQCPWILASAPHN